MDRPELEKDQPKELWSIPGGAVPGAPILPAEQWESTRGG